MHFYYCWWFSYFPASAFSPNILNQGNLLSTVSPSVDMIQLSMQGYLLVTHSHCKTWGMGAILLTWLIAVPDWASIKVLFCCVQVKWLHNQSAANTFQCSVYFITEWRLSKIIEAIESNKKGYYNTFTNKNIKFNTYPFCNVLSFYFEVKIDK
jgi:hypothetical protein